MSEQNRILYFDTAKSLLIWLVIIGHIIEQGMKEGSIENSIFNFIFFFAMPLFIIISGYFTSSSSPLKGESKIIETYIVFQIIHTVLTFNTSFWNFAFYPKWTLWYLFSLASWKFLYYLLQKRFHAVAILGMSLIGSIIVPFLPFPSHFLSLERTFSLFPFFMIGMVLKQKKINVVDTKNGLLYASFLIISVFVLALAYPIELRWLINWNTHYVDMPLPNLYSVIARICVIAMCSVMSLAFLIICSKINIIFLQNEGKKSLKYYMYHSLILVIVFKLIRRFSLIDIPLSYAEAFMLGAFVIAGICIFSNYRFSTILLNPYTYFNQKSLHK